MNAASKRSTVLFPALLGLLTAGLMAAPEMDAIRATLREKLWRRGRGIARALLLTGALAGMSLGSVAYGQISFKSASSATTLQAPAPPTASPGTSGSITFRAAASAAVNAGVTTLTITKPTGTVQNDVMITSIAIRPNAATITLLAGWTLVRRTDSLAVYRKVAGASEPASYAWTLSGGHTGAAGGIQTFIGVDTTNPIDVENGAPTGVTTTPATPSVTTRVVNTMLVTSHGIYNRNLWANPPTWGGTQGFQARAGVASIMAQGSWALRAAIGATGTKTATDLGPEPTDYGTAHILALRPATNRLTITTPAGTVAGDVLVASIGFRPQCAPCGTPASNYGIVPPSGWTALPQLTNAPGPPTNPPSNSLAVYWKVAGASEPAAYQWSFWVSGGASFEAASGGILKFSGADVEPVAPIIGVEENGQNTTAGAQTTPSITTTMANTMLVTSHSYASTTTAAWIAPSGMTSPAAVDVKAGQQSTAIFYGVQSVAGATGQKRAIPTPDDDIGNAHILALRTAKPGTALTIPIPTGTAASDVMIAAIAVRGADRSITPPLGWSEVRRAEQTTGTANLQVFYVRAAGASEPASYTWTLAATNTGAVGGILSFSGVDTTAPIDAHGGNWSPGTGGAITADQITTNGASTVAVSAHSFVSSANWSPAAPVDVASRLVPNGVGISLAMYPYPVQASPGLTGNKTATASNDFDTGIAQILALRPVVPPLNAYETSTAAGAITGVIKTRIAGANVSLDIIALNAAKTLINTTFTGTVRVEVLDASNNSGALDGDRCRPAWTVIQTLSPDPVFVAGDNGRKTISFTQANSYPNARLRITFPAGAPTVTGCSGDNFALRPNTFAGFSVTDYDAQTEGTLRPLNNVSVPAGVTHNAGRPFTVQATAVNAAGTPATTTNYTGAPTATLSDCSPAGNACTATFGTFTIGASFATGVLTSNVATYSEAGSFGLQLVDSTFASVDATDGTPADCSASGRYVCSAQTAVGRFVPDHFILSAPTLTNRRVLGCAPASSFTYQGEELRVTFTLTARNGLATPATTANYSTATNLAQLAGTAIASLGFAAVDLADATPPTAATPLPSSRLTLGTSSGTWINGSASFTADLAVSRTSPDGPFESFRLGVLPVDADGVTLRSADLNLDTDVPMNGNDRVLVGSSKIRFGRLTVGNARGSQLVPLRVPFETQYWDGTRFITNAQDHCTTVANSSVQVTFDSPATSLVACETAVSSVVAASSGRGALMLAAPGNSNPGSVNLTMHLGSTASGNYCSAVGSGGNFVATSPANRAYLQGNWTGALYDDNPPTVRATMGVYKGSDEVIYVRENF